MPIKVEAAIVTQKRPSADFNTDSVNVNGKVFSREAIKKGYKGSGVLNGNVFFALTSSDIEGFADAAVTAFNDRAEKFAVARDPRSVFSGYYEDCRSALLKMDRNENDLVSACLYAAGRKVVMARNSGAEIYAHRLGIFSHIVPELAKDTVAEYDNVVFSDVSEGDIFVLLSPGVAKVLSEKDIEDTFRVSGGSVKRIVSLISKVALAREGTEAVSIIAVKILETAAEENAAGTKFAPDFSYIAPENEADESEANIEHVRLSPAEDGDDEHGYQASEGHTDAPQLFTVDSDSPEVKEKDVAESFSEKAFVLYNEMDESVNTVADNTNSEVNDAAKRFIIETDAEEKTEDVKASNEETVAVEKEASDENKADAAVEEYISTVEAVNGDAEAEEASDKNDNIESDKDEASEKRRIKTKLKLLIALSALLVLSVVMLAVIIATRGIAGNHEETTVSAETTTEAFAEETTEEETSEEETTEEEAGTEEETTTEEERNDTPVNSTVPSTSSPTTTRAPETEAPETEAPETEAPETEAPETEAPETEAPETDAPETEAPETEAPETEAPATEAETSPATTEAPAEIPTQSQTEAVAQEGEENTGDEE